jgi:ADP-ribose pyrophosphatase YjhB (NUDIX family)
MNQCSNCGGCLIVTTPPGDDRPRFFCPACHTVHYENPKMVVGCIPEHNDRILLCRRAIEPRLGLWTLPAGYLENGETVNAGAEREAFEEARAHLADLSPYLLFNICHINQMYLMFRARLADLNFSAGSESLEVKLFDETQIPWNELAFPVITETLRHYFKDRVSGRFAFGIFDILPTDSSFSYPRDKGRSNDGFAEHSPAESITSHEDGLI